MKPQAKIVRFESERDQLLVRAMHHLIYAVALIRYEATPNSLGIACMLVKDVAGILDACYHFPAAPHARCCPIDLDELDRIIAEDIGL
jgi:hypothetical protein